MGGRGVEQTALALSKTPISSERGTESGTLNGENTPIDPNLARLIEVWPTLSDEARADILRLGGIR
jgi:hypothetical protein